MDPNDVGQNQVQPEQVHTVARRIMLGALLLLITGIILFLIYQNGKSIYTHGL